MLVDTNPARMVAVRGSSCGLEVGAMHDRVDTLDRVAPTSACADMYSMYRACTLERGHAGDHADGLDDDYVTWPDQPPMYSARSGHMRLKLTQPLRGGREVGELVEVSERVARRLVHRGLAERADLDLAVDDDTVDEDD